MNADSGCLAATYGPDSPNLPGLRVHKPAWLAHEENVTAVGTTRHGARDPPPPRLTSPHVTSCTSTILRKRNPTMNENLNNVTHAAVPVPMIEEAVRAMHLLSAKQDLSGLAPHLLLVLPWRKQGFTPLPRSEECPRVLVLSTKSGIYLALDTHDAGTAIFEPTSDTRPEVWANGLRLAADKGVMGTREDLFAWALTRESRLTEGLLSITDPHLLLTDPLLQEAVCNKVAAARKDAGDATVNSAVDDADSCIFIPENDTSITIDEIKTRLAKHLREWLAARPIDQFVVHDWMEFDYEVFAERDRWLEMEYRDYYLP